MDAKEFGKKLKALRKTKGMSQEELGHRLGLQRSTISNYEIGRRFPKLIEMQKIAEILGVDLDYFGFEKEKNVYDLIARARITFEDDNIEQSEKAKIYKEVMRLYLEIVKD